jgi:hypothetical protein
MRVVKLTRINGNIIVEIDGTEVARTTQPSNTQILEDWTNTPQIARRQAEDLLKYPPFEITEEEKQLAIKELASALSVGKAGVILDDIPGDKTNFGRRIFY